MQARNELERYAYSVSGLLISFVGIPLRIACGFSF